MEVFGERAFRNTLQAVGNSYKIEITNPTGQACEVMAVVLLHVLDGKIIQEDPYYEPESLIRCGWAQ